MRREESIEGLVNKEVGDDEVGDTVNEEVGDEEVEGLARMQEAQ